MQRIPIRIFVPAQFRSDCIKWQFILRVNIFIAFLFFCFEFLVVSCSIPTFQFSCARFYFHLKLALFFSYSLAIEIIPATLSSGSFHRNNHNLNNKILLHCCNQKQKVHREGRDNDKME